MDKWRDDIEKYLGGKMTPAERHALEKKALTDPFLADALEGAEFISAEDFTSDLNELNQKINGAGKNRWLWPLRIAASVIGIMLVSTAIFYSMQEDEIQMASTQKPTESTAKEEKKVADTLLIAENKSAQEEAKESEDQSGASTTSSSKTLTKEKPKLEGLIALQSPKETKNETAGGSGVASANPTTASIGPSKLKLDSGALSGLAEASLASSSIKMDSIADLKEAEMADDVVAPAPVVQPDFIKSESKATARSKRLLTESKPTATAPTQQPVTTSDESSVDGLRKGTGLNLVVNGQVRDQQGQPIPGVNVVVKGSSNGTVTDAEGKYSIALSDQNQALVYSFIGFVAQEQPVDKAKAGDSDIQLKEDATQLSEVVVTGYGTQKKDGEPVVRLAEPVGGMKAYDQYLEDKKIYPQQALDNKVEGRVVVEFTVSTTGALSDFNVVRKIGYGCEEEVIRLVKEGPKWYPTYIDNEAVESLVRVKTRFDLPTKK